jgi:hypothetical protein
LSHCFFEGAGAVVGRVEFDADCEGWGHDFAGFIQDVEDEAGTLFGGAAVFVGAAVCLDEGDGEVSLNVSLL